MTAKLQCFLFLVLITAIDLSADSKDFCSAFRRNGDKISYVYRSLVDEKKAMHHIVINGLCWRLKYDGIALSLENNRYLGTNCPLFSDEYSMAACIRFSGHNNWKDCSPILFSNKNWKSVTIGDTNSNPNDLSKYVRKESALIYGDLSVNVTGVPLFVLSLDQSKAESYVIFVDVTGKEFRGARWYYYTIARSNQNVNIKKHPSLQSLIDDQSAIYQLNTKYEVIGISPDWTNDAFGYFFIFKDNLKLRWCWTSGADYVSDKSTQRCTEVVEELIDCSNTPVPKGTSTPVSEGNSLMAIIIVIIVVIVAIVIMVGIVIFLCTRKSSGEEADVPKGDASNVLSKRSANVSKAKTSKPIVNSAASATDSRFSNK